MAADAVAPPQHHASFENYVEGVLAELRRDPGRPALVAADGRTITAGTLHDEVRAAAAGLAACGVRRGDSVAFLTGDRPEAVVARYAANLLGARVLFLGAGMSAAVQADIVASVDATVLLVDPECRAAAEALLARVAVPAVLTLGTPLPSPGATPTTEPATEPAPGPATGPTAQPAAERAAQPAADPVRPEDDWCLRFTGGTTGTPKGIPMAHGPYRQLLDRLAGRLRADAPPRALACTSLAHMAGILADAALLAGGTVVLRPGFDPGDVLAALERERITDVWLLPPLLYELLDHPAAAGADLSALRRLFYGGTVASAERLRQAAALFGPVLHGWYGQTEAGSITEVGPHEHGITGPGGRITAGRAEPGVVIEIRDPAGAVLPAGENGEVHVRTPMTMTGYWRRPDLTAEVLHEGWIRTGDVGHLDAAGYLHLVDRLKDMVVVVGGHVYPADVEQALLAHPAVSRCAAFGVQRADGTEELHVAIVPAAGHRPDGGPVRAFVTERLGPMYAPAAVHVVERLPLTEVGKPDRRLLRATLASGRT
ncbi:class I adenylate-forming enzyme family protein [Kitasatospora sp. NPDC127111]|uniref:class I adenylate-forming enzyme family protein n=1 Tax=Kitasatospora sp. NPDC127111 TaxID=3345363 RepID=UPI00363AC43D